MIQISDLLQIIPLLIISGAAIISLVIDAFSKNKNIVFWFSLLSVVAALAFAVSNINMNTIILNGFIKVSILSTTFIILILTSIVISIIASKSYIEKEGINFGEYYSLMLFSVMGMILMVQANDLLIVFLGLELMSICFYVLAGFMRKRTWSNESAMKYFLLGAFMTGFLLFGISLMYGSSGTTNLSMIASTPALKTNAVFLIGLGLFLLGFFFKLGVFPFHMWIPDVYEGAPTTITGMMSTAGKIAAVGILLPIVLSTNVAEFRVIFSTAAILTMLFGNVIAIAQTNIKRLLAYSSIASAGYIMVGIAAMNDLSIKGITYYLIAYVFMQLGAFIVVSILEQNSKNTDKFSNLSLNDYKGLAKNNPVLAMILTIFLFSLAGIPPFAGFWGKYYLFYAAIQANLIWLSIIGITLSVISVYYYIKIIVYMWFQDAEDAEHAQRTYSMPAFASVAIVLTIIGTLVFGLFPEIFFNLFKV